MKILITGANGFLGQHLTMYFDKKLYDVYPVSRGICRIPNHDKHYLSVDLTHKTAVNELISGIQPDVIIHTAAMSKPDECHLNRADCLLHNVTATGYLIEAAKNVNAHLIYISTDFIFGEGGPYAENKLPEPLNFYGESKLMAEKLVQSAGIPNTIVRPVFIYGSYWDGMRPSFIQWVRNNLAAGKPIKVVTDQFRTPTYVLDICVGIELILKQGANGIFHLAGKDILSPYEMAITVARVTGLDETLIEPVTAAVFPEIVQRARHSGLKIDKAKSILGYDPISFEEGVRQSFDVKA